jgi:hypothetical protein
MPLEKLVVTHLVKKFLVFMKPKYVLPCSQERYPVPDKSSALSHLVFQVYFNIIHPSTPGSHNLLLHVRYFDCNFMWIPHLSFAYYIRFCGGGG